MTETLTYNPTDPNAPALSSDEQDSLEVAEKLGQEEAELLAGKFNSTEDLENAYLALQKKLGSGGDDEEQSTLDEDEYYDEATSAGIELITNASDEYYANEGQLSPDTIEQFKEMSSSDLVNAYIAIQENNPQAGGGTAADLTDAEVNQIHNSAGGEAEYSRLLDWASDNADSRKMDAFNSIIQNGNATAIQIAVAGLRSEYENQQGYEGRMLTGKAARVSNGFRSQAEVVQAMSDPRYDSDPAYRQDVYDKLENSNVQF